MWTFICHLLWPKLSETRSAIFSAAPDLFCLHLQSLTSFLWHQNITCSGNKCWQNPCMQCYLLHQARKLHMAVTQACPTNMTSNYSRQMLLGLRFVTALQRRLHTGIDSQLVSSAWCTHLLYHACCTMHAVPRMLYHACCPSLYCVAFAMSLLHSIDNAHQSVMEKTSEGWKDKKDQRNACRNKPSNAWMPGQSDKCIDDWHLYCNLMLYYTTYHQCTKCASQMEWLADVVLPGGGGGHEGSTPKGCRSLVWPARLPWKRGMTKCSCCLSCPNCL